MKKKDMRSFSQGLMIAALLAVIAAFWGFISTDIILASTQWLLVAAVLAIFGLWTRMES